MGSFFKDHKKDFHVEPEYGVSFRKCQLGAIWGVKSHFTKSNDPALISMPTGTGKTALMEALAFEFKASRVLIITPTRIIRNQIAEEFSTLKTLRDIGAVKFSENVNPKVIINKNECSSEFKWEELIENFDVVVSTPHTISSAINGIVPPPKNSFDLVIFDEAHHAAATTWNALIEEFKGSKIVLLTATPFRRDKKKIKGKLVYHYSITAAIEEGIYRKVEYIPVNTSLDTSKKDVMICEEAIRIYKEELVLNSTSKLLIKTESIKHAEHLCEIYNKRGVKVEAIHSKKSDATNEFAINKCKSNIIQGIVCVGMAGEGLDIPELKIAVLHEIPSTLPFTIQFIGRVSRNNSKQIGNAYLITDPQYVNGEVKKLYKYDKGWHKLIPDLVDEIVAKLNFVNEIAQDLLNPLEIDINDLEPYFSVRIYKTTSEFRFDETFLQRLTNDIEIVLCEQENEASPLVIITKKDEELSWGKNIPLNFAKYDLHIFLIIGQFLFEYTSSDYYCNKLKRALLDSNTYKRVDSSVIKKGLSDSTGNEYYMIGMDNTSGINKSNPRYKMYMGREVQSALRITDGRIFSAGHALAKINSSETRGISLHNSRIWAVSRDNLEGFCQWCSKIYNIISNTETSKSIPQMDFLSETKIVTKFPEQPISVLFDGLFFDSVISTTEIEGQRIVNSNLRLEHMEFSKNMSSLTCNILMVEHVDPIKLTYNLNAEEYWKVDSNKNINIHLDFGNNDSYRGTLQQYINDNPPLIVLRSGQTIRNNTLYTPKIQTEKIDQEIYKKKNWDDTDIKMEAKPPNEKYKYNVQEKTIKFINEVISPEDFIINDDRSGEVADIIVIKPKKKEIEFYHCKFKTGKGRKPGADKQNIAELIDQGIRNGNWIYSSKLIDRLIERLEGNSILVQGCFSELKNLNKTYYPNQWNYKIVLVQPGIIKESVFKLKPTNIEKLLCVLFDRTIGINASLEIWGS